MEKYLLEILKDSNTIIIPGLGALTATNKEKGEYMFMPYLKHDDGTLKRFIATIEGCDEVEARTKIDQFVEAVNSTLNSGGSYEIPDFGTFSKDNSGDLVFDSNASPEGIRPEKEEDLPFLEPIPETELVPEVEAKIESLDDEIVVEETVQVEAVLEQEVTNETGSINREQTETSQTEQDEIDIDAEDENSEVETVVVESVQDIEPVEVVLSNEDEVVSTVNANSAEYTEQQQWEDDLDLPPINAKVERPKKPIIEKAKKDKKRRSPLFYGLIVLVVLLVGGATTVGVFYNQIKTALFAEEKSDTTKLAEGKQFEFTEDPVNETGEPIKETEEETTETPVETEPEVTEPIETPVVKEVPKPKVVEPKKTTANGSYFLVVGSFQNEANANRFSEKMRSEGNDSNVIGPNNGFYLVTIGSYSTESDAKSGLSEKIQRYPKVWLYKKV